MKLKAFVITGALVLGVAASAFADSNASVQKGRLSLEGIGYSCGNLGLTAEVGLSNNVAVKIGNADHLPTLQLKFQVPNVASNSVLAVNGGLYLADDPGMTLGLNWHYKVNGNTRIFVDASVYSHRYYTFANFGGGLAYNITKDLAVIGAARNVAGHTDLGIGLRFTL